VEHELGETREAQRGCACRRLGALAELKVSRAEIESRNLARDVCGASCGRRESNPRSQLGKPIGGSYVTGTKVRKSS
jgi:hypothetical protein